MSNTNLYLDFYGLHRYDEKIKKYIDKKVKTDDITISKNASGELEVTGRFIQGLKDYISENYASNTKVSQIISRLNTLIGSDEEGHKIDVTSVIDTFNEIKDFLANIEDTTLKELFNLVNTRISNTLLLVGIDDIPEFDSTENYSTNDLVIYSDKLYKFIETHSAGAWIGTDTLETDLIKEIDQTLTETYSLVESVNNALAELSPDQEEALGVATKANANEAKLGYYVCDTDRDVAAKTVVAANYVLGTGGSIKVKMTNDNTVDNATLNINSTGAKPLFHEGARASSTNTWAADDVLEIYYDGTNYQAMNISPTFKTGEKVNSVGIDDEPKAGSDNLIKSGGVYPYVIKVEELREEVADIQPIVIEGNVNNAPDQEDLTSVNQGGTDVLKLKDKTYAPALFSGMGRVYLRKNVVTPENLGYTINLLTAEMISQPNTIYHIQYDYDLDGKAITIPEGCILQFEGGSLTNGTLIGNDTLIVANNYHIFKDIDTKNSIDITDSFYSNSDNKNHKYNGVKTTSKVGDSITMTKDPANTLDSVELDVNCGDVFRITGRGGTFYNGDTWRIFTFVDSNNKVTLISKIGFFGKNLLVSAPTDGKVYIQLDIDGRPDREVRTYNGDYKVEKLNGYFTLQGTFKNREFHPEWFGAIGDGVTDDTEAIQRLLDTTQMLERPTQMTIMLDNYYRITKGLIIYACTTLKGHWVHTQNNPYNAKGDTTIICDFQNTSDWAIQSANLNPPTGALLSLRKVLWRTVVDGGDFCYCDSLRIENVAIVGSLTNELPIYGGVRISASNNSSLSDVKINKFMVGIARGATWYSSDKNVWASNYYISYVADQDMNNFSVYNAYLTTISSNIEITDDNVWSTDKVKKRTDVFTNYANGTFINPICESAPNGMTFQNYSSIVIIKPWMEGLTKNAFCANTLCNITILNPMIVIGNNVNLLQNAAKSYTTAFTLIGANIKGQIDLSENDNVVMYGNGTTAPINTPAGVTLYDRTIGKHKHWNGTKWVNEEGFAYQDSIEGIYSYRPSVEGMKPGTIYMKQEGNGNVRPLFQKTAGIRAKGMFTITTVGLTSGDIVFTVGNTIATITVPVVAEETIDEFRLRIARLLASALGSEKVNIVNGIITIYNNDTSTITENEISFDGGTTGIECTIDKSVLGNPPEFVGAFGDTGATDIVAANLPSTAKNGDIIIWTNIGKPVYYYNNKWRDFTGNSVEGGIELISGELIQNVNAAAHQIVLTITSKDAQQQPSQVLVSSDFEGLTSTVELTDSSTSLYTVTINIPMNVEIAERTILYTITQAASSAVINGSVTQSGISTDVTSFTELAAGTALYAPIVDINGAKVRPYINTGLLPNNNYKIEIKAKAKALGGKNNYQLLFGSGGWDNGQKMFGLTTSGKLAGSISEYVKAHYNNVASPDSVAADTLEHIYILDGNKFYIDGTLIHTFDEATFSVTDTRYKLRIYGIQIRSAQTYFDGSVFYAKIWDENGTLVRDYVPVKHNVVDLYTWKDKVTNTIYNSPNGCQFELLEESQNN